jgi:hypothetical protein
MILFLIVFMAEIVSMKALTIPILDFFPYPLVSAVYFPVLVIMRFIRNSFMAHLFKVYSVSVHVAVHSLTGHVDVPTGFSIGFAVKHEGEKD